MYHAEQKISLFYDALSSGHVSFCCLLCVCASVLPFILRKISKNLCSKIVLNLVKIYGIIKKAKVKKVKGDFFGFGFLPV